MNRLTPILIAAFAAADTARAGRVPGQDVQTPGGTITDEAVSVTYSEIHWSSGAYADFRGPAGSPTDLVYAAGWWYRLNGVDTRDYPLPLPTSETYAGADATIVWTNVDGKGFDLREDLAVFDNERPSGTFTSRLVATNNSGAPLSLTFFHYLDADAEGTSSGDHGTQSCDRVLSFDDGQLGAFGYYRGRGATHYAVRPYLQLLDQLNDTALTTLDDAGTPFGPGDWTAAYQWDVSVGNGIGERVVAEVLVSYRVPRLVEGDLLLNDNPDVLFWKPGTGELEAWNMRRTTQFETRVFTPEARRPVGLADFTGNCENDIVLQDLATGEVSFEQLSPWALVPLAGAGPLPLDWKLSATADFNRDGHPDIVWRNRSTQKIAIWTMGQGAPGWQKTGSIVPSPDQAVDNNWEIVGARDFNADGKVDFLWYNATTGKIVIWYMDAAVVRVSGGFTNPPNAGDNNWQVVATADYGKGYYQYGGAPAGSPDLLWRNATSGKLVVWHMDSAGNRLAGLFATPASAGDLAWQVVGPR